jgi:FkbM family methyltransferase
MSSFQYRGTTVHYVDGIGGSIWSHLEKGRWYEQDMLEHISSLNLRGTYLDVGANIGTHSVYFSMFCKSERVIGIEAYPLHARWAMEFSELNRLNRKLSILPVAAGSETGFMDIVYAFGRADNVPRVFNALCVKIDDFAPPGVSLIKMDIEGAEPEALKGAIKVLERDRPVLFIEASTAEDLDKVESIIGPLGYRKTAKSFRGSPTYEFTHSAQ